MGEADELARRVAEALHARAGTSAAWGIAIEEIREGYARIAMTVTKDMLNGHDVCHGGMIFALADSAFAYACNSRNIHTMAQQASIVFVAPGRLGERLIAEAKEQAQARRSGVYQIRVRKETGEDVALFQGLSRSIGGEILPSS
jgi:acyl-CoA thioesterase